MKDDMKQLLNRIERIYNEQWEILNGWGSFPLHGNYSLDYYRGKVSGIELILNRIKEERNERRKNRQKPFDKGIFDG